MEKLWKTDKVGLKILKKPYFHPPPGDNIIMPPVFGPYGHYVQIFE